MWGLFLAGDGDHLDGLETGLLKEGVESVFGEAQPDIGVKFAGLFEIVFAKIEDKELAAGFEDAEGLGDRFLRMLGVVKSLAEDGEIHRCVGKRDLLDVTELVGEVREAVFLGERGADLDHLGRTVDAPDLPGAAGEELGDQTLAGAEVGDDDGRGETKREVADGFPRAAGAVVFTQAAGDEVEVFLLVGAALGEGAGEAGAVGGELGLLGNGVGRGAEEGEGGGGERGAEAVISALAVAAVDDEFGGAEEGELGGDARLGHVEDLLEFGDGKLLAEQEGEDAQAGGLGDELEGVPGGVHARFGF